MASVLDAALVAVIACCGALCVVSGIRMFWRATEVPLLDGRLAACLLFVFGLCQAAISGAMVVLHGWTTLDRVLVWAVVFAAALIGAQAVSAD